MEQYTTPLMDTVLISFHFGARVDIVKHPMLIYFLPRIHTSILMSRCSREITEQAVIAAIERIVEV